MKTFGTGQTSGLPLQVTASLFADRQLLHTAVAGSSSVELVTVEVENGPVMVEVATAAASVVLEVERSLTLPLNGAATLKVWDKDPTGNKTALVRAIVETQTGTAAVSIGGLAVDEIAEQTAAAGVTVDGVLLKDSTVKTDTVVEKTAAAGVTLDGTKLKDGGVVCADGATIEADTIVEATADAGVTIETVALEDGTITMPDAGNIVLNGTTGTKIGTATTQKLGLFNATPVVQPAAAAQAAIAATLTDNTGGSGTHDDTLADGLTSVAPAAYSAHASGAVPVTSNAATDLDTTAAAVANLRGVVATLVTDVTTQNQNASDLAQKVIELVALVNAMRTALVALGAMKGAA